MMALTLLALLPAELPVIESRAFDRAAQEKALQATVRIVNVRRSSEGSGAILRRSGPFVYFLTAAHVVAGTDDLQVQTFTAASYPKPATVYRSAEVVAQSAESDLAVLRVATTDALPGQLPLAGADDAPPTGGFTALSSGCAAGTAPTCESQQVLGKKHVRRPGQDGQTWCWEVKKPSAKGRSGGPLVDRKGRLIGVASGTDGTRGYVIHPQEIHAFLRANALDWLSEKDG